MVFTPRMREDHARKHRQEMAERRRTFVIDQLEAIAVCLFIAWMCLR